MLGPNVITMQLPYDQDWLWYREWNILALAPHLDAEGRERAVDEFQAKWCQALNIPAPRQRHSPRWLSGLTTR